MKRRLISMIMVFCVTLGSIYALPVQPAAQATDQLTVTTQGASFVISRPYEKEDAIIRYRTVNGSAVAGIHYEHIEGELHFSGGEGTKVVSALEYPIEAVNGINKFQQTGRTYSLEVMRSNGYTKFCTRTMPAANDYNIKSAGFIRATDLASFYSTAQRGEYDVPQMDTNSGIIDDDNDWNYKDRQKINITDFLKMFGTNAPEYFKDAGVKIGVRMYFDAWENADGYQDIQLYTNGGKPKNLGGRTTGPNYMTSSNLTGDTVYYAEFSHDDSDAYFSRQPYAFPVVGVGNNAKDVSEPWEVSGFFDKNGDQNTDSKLMSQAFRSSAYRSPNGSYVLLPATDTEVALSCAASGQKDDLWIFGEFKFFATVFDNTTPKVKAVHAPEGTWYVGDKTTFAVEFSEIVNVTGIPTIQVWLDDTIYMSATYEGGTGTNILYFSSTVDCNGSYDTITLKSLSGTIKDIVNNTYITSTGLSVSDSIDIKEITKTTIFYIDGANVSISSPEATSTTLILASYNNGRLSNVKYSAVDIKAGKSIYTVQDFTKGTGDTVKAFLWKDMITLNPFCNSLSVE